MNGKLVSLFLTAALATPAAVVGQSGAPDLRVEQPWARRAAMLTGGGNSAVYATIVNAGNMPDALLAAGSDAAEAVEVHETYQQSGMTGMRRVQRIEVPAGGRVELKPGGFHIMLLNLKHDLKPNSVVELVLRFDGAGRVPVRATVR